MTKALRLWHAYATLLAYTLFRLWLIPSDVAVTAAFTHDSGYLSIVARNVAQGAGFINQAHWLLFLDPPRLPIPYHNANPFYPALSALVSQLSGWDVTHSGAVVSLLGHVILGVAVFLLVTAFEVGPLIGCLAAIAVMFFPVNFRESFAVLPDALATGLGVAVWAVVVRARSSLHWLAGGVLFGLAWLTRSTALLSLPVLVLYVVCRHGWRLPLRWLALFAAAALLTISPWLIHTARTWGSPLRSDAIFYWLQNYHAQRKGIEVNQYWRGLLPPPSFKEVLREDALGFATQSLRGIPVAAWQWMAQIAFSSKVCMAFFGMSLGLGAWQLRRQHRYWLEVLAMLLLAALTFLSLTVRGASLEARYLGLSNVCLALLAFAACFLRPVWLAAPAWMFWLALVPMQNWRSASQLLSTQPDLITYRQAAQEFAQRSSAGPVVTPMPYFYTYYTGQPAISPPYPGKSELIAVMRKYGASQLWVPPDPEFSLQFLYPGAPASLRPEFISDLFSTTLQLQLPTP